MLSQAVHLLAERDELMKLLARLEEADWQRTTQFKRWTINDVVLHLHATDWMALASLESPERFASLLADIYARRAQGLSLIEDTRLRFPGLAGARLRDVWHRDLGKLCELLGARNPDDRLKWAGPDMGVRMFTTARQMEVWAHGQEIYDLLGEDRVPTDRLRNIAQIGVRTFGWTFANRKLPVPEDLPYVRLDAPSGALWEWNPPSETNRVEGAALEFCQVVAQTRNIADTRLKVTGDTAMRWMAIAQCFAGPPNDPPAPGSRHRARR